MLILTRRIGETLNIGDNVQVTVLGIKGHQVRIGINAPKDVQVHREEIHERIKLESMIKEMFPDIYREEIHEHIEHIKQEGQANQCPASNAPHTPEVYQGDWFEWPSTVAPPGPGKILPVRYPEGLLSFVGYRVGKTKGLPDDDRKDILDKVFHNKLPRVNSDSYMAEFGDPEQPARLEKMAHVLAAMARNYLRNDTRDYSMAIHHYKMDLDYLYDKYYVGKFGFDRKPGFAWPKYLPTMLDSPPSGGKITAVPQFSSIARPYAEAVFALAQEANDFDRWSAFLARAAAVAADAQVARLIQDPRVARETLFGIVADLSVKGEGEAQRNFLRLLIANRRARALPDIAAQFEKLRAEAEGTVDAELVTAFAVSDAQKEKIAAALSRKLGRKVRLSVSEDGDLIGGAIVRAGDLVIDASVRGQLEQLKNALRA